MHIQDNLLTHKQAAVQCIHTEKDQNKHSYCLINSILSSECRPRTAAMLTPSIDCTGSCSFIGTIAGSHLQPFISLSQWGLPTGPPFFSALVGMQGTTASCSFTSLYCAVHLPEKLHRMHTEQVGTKRARKTSSCNPLQLTAVHHLLREPGILSMWSQDLWLAPVITLSWLFHSVLLHESGS